MLIFYLHQVNKEKYRCTRPNEVIKDYLINFFTYFLLDVTHKAFF